MALVATCPVADLVEADSRRRICGGELLLRIRLDVSEIAAPTEPAPLFRLVQRLAYLPSLFADVYEHFKTSLPPQMGQAYEIWFDYDGVALKWHFPIGVLCDLLVGSSVPVPLDVTVHFRGGNGSRDLLPFEGISSLEKVVMNAFRQAVFLEQNDSAPFMKLKKQQQTLLWESIAKCNMEAFAALIRQHFLCQSLSKCKSLAVRLHFIGPVHDTLLHPAPPLQEGEPPTPSTVLSFLLQAVPLLVDSASGELKEGVEILTHGVVVPADTPLYWLALNANYLDHFVHLVVRTPESLNLAGPAGAADLLGES